MPRSGTCTTEGACCWRPSTSICRRTPAFRADHLLLNAVAALALDDELAAIASRRSVARGFGRVEPSSRLLWRAGVIGTPVLLVLGLALIRRTGSRVHARPKAA